MVDKTWMARQQMKAYEGAASVEGNDLLSPSVKEGKKP